MAPQKETNIMYEQFKARAEAVGADVHRFKGKEEALDFILPFLRKEGIADAPGSLAVWADCPFLKGMNPKLLAEVAGLRFEVSRNAATGARIGITQVEWALADTGTLVQDQTAVEQRLASSLTDIHIALVPTNGILPDKVALLARINPGTSRYIAFITGPSRTADIERVLTIGVHGPERLVIVCVDEMGEVVR
jgi:L-lactate dehydrogenase complex protein LldG